MFTHAQQNEIQRLGTRHGRKKSSAFLVEGICACSEALNCRPEWGRVLVVREDSAPELVVLANEKKIPVERVSHELFSRLSCTETPQGVILLADRPDGMPPKAVADPFILVLEKLADPGNVGTILRCAWACGLQHIAVVRGTADPYGPKAVRAGMGAQFALEMSFYEDTAAVRQHFSGLGFFRLWQTVPRAGKSVFSPEFNLASSLLVLGNEAAGVDWMADAENVSIPMPGHAESLNVAQAATVFLFDAVRRGILAG